MTTENKGPTHNFSYQSSAAAVVFGGHLSARAAFRLDPDISVRSTNVYSSGRSQTYFKRHSLIKVPKLRIFYYLCNKIFNKMDRIFAKSTLREYWEKHPDSEQYLKTWYDTAMCSDWKTPSVMSI